MNCGLAVSLVVITHLLFRWSLDKAIQRIIIFILYCDAKTLSFDSVVCGQTEVLAILLSVCHFSCNCILRCHVLDQFMQY